MIWEVEVHLLDIMTGATRVIKTGESVSTDIVVQLAQVKARFVLDGIKYYGEAPTVDPINRKLVYFCEGYPTL